MNLYKQFKTREQAELDGVWVQISPTARLKIARSNNPRHQASIKRLSHPYLKPGMRSTDIPDDTWEQITREAAAETILVDWDGIVDVTEQPLPYSKAEAMKVLALKDFAEVVFRIANSMEHYREERIAELEKN